MFPLPGFPRSDTCNTAVRDHAQGGGQHSSKSIPPQGPSCCPFTSTPTADLPEPWGPCHTRSWCGGRGTATPSARPSRTVSWGLGQGDTHPLFQTLPSGRLPKVEGFHAAAPVTAGDRGG